MPAQWVRYGASNWTIRQTGESTEDFVARVPAGQSAPDGGDCTGGHAEWVSGGFSIEVCTKCNDTPQTECEEFHDATVEALMEQFPEDP